jgi:uncharacterized protein (UPF0276 family)
MLPSISDLPVLGLGVSLSLSSEPDPVVLVRAKGGPQFVEYAGLADVERVIDEVSRVRAVGAEVLFHPSHINFCGSFNNSTAWIETTAKHISAVNSAWFAQDCAYCFWRGGPGYSTQLGYFIPPILNQASLNLAILRIKEVQAIIPVVVAIEPPPVTFVVGAMPVFSFFGRLAKKADCAILLDMGHLVSYEMATGKKLLDDLASLPCERVIEIHVAGGKWHKTSTKDIYVDAHECEVLPQTWKMLEDLLPLLPNVKAVCFECEGADEKTVFSGLERLRKMIIANSSNAELIAKVGS